MNNSLVKKLITVGVLLPGLAALTIGVSGIFVPQILVARADSIGSITFESPTYTTGLIDGQDGWIAKGASGSGCAVYDEGVASSLGVAGFGAQSFRISDAATSGCFGDQAFAKPVANGAGETAATAGTFSVGTRQSHFETQFDIASTQPNQQPGMHVSVSPDRGDGSRMSYLRFEDGANGIDVFFDDVQQNAPCTPSGCANFVETQVGTGLSRTIPHTVKLTMDFLDGPSNDVVKVYIDGTLVHTGTSWEDYYRYDPEASAEQSPRIVKTVLFRESGTANPGDQGKGFLFDNISLSSGNPDQICTPINLVSGTNTQTAGETNINPNTDANGLLPGNYIPGSFSNAVPVNLTPTGFTLVPGGPWIDPSLDSNFAGSGAVWISTVAAAPGDTGGQGLSTEDQWRLFENDFNVPVGATVNPVTLHFTADNGATAYFNGVALASTTGVDTYGPVPNPLPSAFGNVFTAAFTPVAGQTNKLQFVVRNSAYPIPVNPTGLLYRAQGQYCEPVQPPPPTTVTVTLAKYVDNGPATAQGTNNASFPMTATWNATNIGAGTGGFSLGPVGFNNPNPYQATTADMTSGANYSATENLPTTCNAGNPYALVGYTTGASLEAAASSTPTSTAPSFTDLRQNVFVIVWNKTCEQTPPTFLKVHILKYLDGQQAMGNNVPGGYQFPMTATWRTANLDGGAQTAGTYVLGNNHGGAPDLYGADTAPMQAPADYTTSEITDGASNVLPSDASCVPGKFRLDGYQVSTSSFADAATQATSTNAPNFVGLMNDQYVIVRNVTCPATATLTIEKHTIGGNDTFTMNGDHGIGSFQITTTGTLQNGSGSQTFNNLTPGTYSITEAPKADWTQTENSCSQLVMAAGEDALCVIVNTNNKKLGSIRGIKYEDKDGNGVLRDGDHRRLAGWTMYLDTNNNGVLDLGEPTAVTNSHGLYFFTGLVAGTYHVREVGQPGWIQTYPASGKYDITLAAGQSAKNKNFANFKLGSISGMKFNDANGNHRKDSSETGLGGWTINLMKAGSSNVITSVLTDEDGNYSFLNLGPGIYRVREVQQIGWVQTTDNPPSIKVRSGTTSTKNNFGNHFGSVRKDEDRED